MRAFLILILPAFLLISCKWGSPVEEVPEAPVEVVEEKEPEPRQRTQEESFEEVDVRGDVPEEVLRLFPNFPWKVRVPVQTSSVPSEDFRGVQQNAGILTLSGMVREVEDRVKMMRSTLTGGSLGIPPTFRMLEEEQRAPPLGSQPPSITDAPSVESLSIDELRERFGGEIPPEILILPAAMAEVSIPW